MKTEFKDVFWAKKKEKDGKFYWLPLLVHLEDTKNIMGLLWEHWLGEGLKKLIEESLDKNSKGKGKNLAMFLGAVHDIGKATPAFQTKKGYANSESLEDKLLKKLENEGFEKIKDLTMFDKTPHNIAGQYLLMDYGIGEDIAVIIGGHHGKTVDDLIENHLSSYTANYFQSEDRESDIYKKWVSSQKYIFEWALKISGLDKGENLLKIKQPAQVILLGLLIMADWIASNEDYFPLIPIEQKKVQDKGKRLEDGFNNWRKSSIWEAEYNPDFKSIYEKRFGFQPRNVQTVLSEIIDKTEKPGIFIVEAPMGIGKTEAALVACEQLAYKTGRNGLFFGLPTQATSDGIFPRIKSWLTSIKSELKDNISLRLVHGKAYLNDEFTSLARNINIDGEENENIIINEWFSGSKKTSLDDFVVGTVDQFLLLALKQKHLPLRHLGFGKKVVVIDEVHAYDAYMNQYLLEAIQWMGAYRVPVVILSATLPEERRIKLLINYMIGMGKKWKKSERVKRDESLKTTSYPLITYNDGDEIHQVREFEKIENKAIKIVKIKDDEDLILTVKDMILDGGVVGIIVNTVKRAQGLAKDFSEKFGEETVELLHSGFIATERIRKEKNLVDMIGKGGNRPNKKIIIGTQVIEQSLDIDFDVMISDLAPMDLLIQRMGRLHRHNKTKRPDKHKSAILYVMGINDTLDFEKGSSYVYGDYLLTRTQYFLPEVINLPEDISTLVQEVYADKDINICDNLTKKYNESKRRHESKIEEKESKAKNYRISDPVLKKSSFKENLIGWTKNLTNCKSEEKAYAQVRDIDDTIEVIALKKVDDGYGLFGELTDISKKIGEFNVAKEIAKNTLKLPNILTKPYKIDKTIEELEKYNLRELKIWQESSWLKGSLGIIFDENNKFTINCIEMVYDEKYGISVN